MEWKFYRNRWIYYHAHWRHMANTIEPSVGGGQGYRLSKNTWTDRDAVWGYTVVGITNHVLEWTVLTQHDEYHRTFSCTSLKQQRAAYRSDRAYICNSAYLFIQCWRTRVSHYIFSHENPHYIIVCSTCYLWSPYGMGQTIYIFML